MANYNIILLDQAKYKVWLAGQKLGTSTVRFVETWCKTEGADLCFNLGFFDMKTGIGETYVHTPQGDLGYGGASDLLNVGACICKGYSNGIKNGVVKVEHPLGGSSYRNGIGKTADGSIIIAQSHDKVTETAFCNAVNAFVKKRKKLAVLFVLQDGGGSVSEYSTVSRLNFAPGGNRKVATVVCVKRIGVPTLDRNLWLFSKGDDVEDYQIVLGGIPADGSFGTMTYSRTKKTQKAHGIKADGSCGPVTRKTLGI